MFAVIKTGGKQYKVSEGDTLVIEKLSASAGELVFCIGMARPITVSGFLGSAAS